MVLTSDHKVLGSNPAGGRIQLMTTALHCTELYDLTLSTLGKIFSRRHFEIFFLFFPENRI